MNNDDTEPMLRRTMTSRRVVSLRERLLRAGVTVAYLAPQDVNNPSCWKARTAASTWSSK